MYYKIWYALHEQAHIVPYHALHNSFCRFHSKQLLFEMKSKVICKTATLKFPDKFKSKVKVHLSNCFWISGFFIQFMKKEGNISCIAQFNRLDMYHFIQIKWKFIRFYQKFQMRKFQSITNERWFTLYDWLYCWSWNNLFEIRK